MVHCMLYIFYHSKQEKNQEQIGEGLHQMMGHK